MNTYRPASSPNIWITVLKVLILILALYLSVLILGKVFAVVLTVLFAIFKAGLYVVALFAILHFLLKVLFQYDLYATVIGRWFR